MPQWRQIWAAWPSSRRSRTGPAPSVPKDCGVPRPDPPRRYPDPYRRSRRRPRRPDCPPPRRGREGPAAEANLQRDMVKNRQLVIGRPFFTRRMQTSSLPFTFIDMVMLDGFMLETSVIYCEQTFDMSLVLQNITCRRTLPKLRCNAWENLGFALSAHVFNAFLYAR